MFVGIGIGVGFQRVSGGGAAFDSDYQAVLTYATSLGYNLPSSGQQVKQNQLMLDLKAGGIWAKLDTFAMFANDGGSNFGLIDWKRLTTYTAVNSPTFTSNVGFQGNGSSAWINTNYNPTTNGVNYVLNKASVWMYKYTAGTNGASQLISTNDERTVITNNSSNYHILNTNFGNLGSPPSVSFNVTGLIGQNKTASKTGFRRRLGANTNYLHDGTDLLPNQNIRLLGRTSFTNATSSMFAAGGDFTSEISNFDTIISNYITSL